MQEIIDREQLEQRNTQEREALGASAATRNREDQVTRSGEHAADDDDEQDRW